MFKRFVKMAVIDMQRMRYINLLDKVSHVKTRKCFVHNNTIFFAVESKEVSKAIGPGGRNIKSIQESLGKKVKIIKDNCGSEDVKRFIDDIVSPVKVRNVDVKEDEIIITAGSSQNKASLIGRNRVRYEELNKVIKDFFEKGLRIV